jgi:hypothetical protein
MTEFTRVEKICGNCVHFVTVNAVDGYCEVGGRVDEYDNKNLICYEDSFCIGVNYFESKPQRTLDD